ncbi:hypothetical protein SOVF_016260 isoform A [Spinacia oleracea]|nr:hypothetical protein SOVF_016260 isoform A [Spinacia oleracea]
MISFLRPSVPVSLAAALNPNPVHCCNFSQPVLLEEGWQEI